MAAAGMLAVTNTFENKTANALAAISPNLVAGRADRRGPAARLCSGRGRGPPRRATSAVRWSRSWDESFSDALLDRVTALLA